RYGGPPPRVADLAFDAASIARALAPSGDPAAALTAANGFEGSDGWLRLLPDGRVERGLAVFQIEAGGPAVIAPAPVASAA
ncbi:MAG: penicillin-binding protein activator, partial [Pseudomonadota bacterium]|nr:penicillin-binding protein activator [Pseudomonadota bacterium]